MATQPTDTSPVTGRVDGRGWLVAADPQLELLQREAGSGLGAPIAIPQLAAIVRIARQLRIPVARRAIAAGAAQDIDMWVRAVPEGDEVALTIERWDFRPPVGPRLATVADGEIGPGLSAGRYSLDERLCFVSVSEAAADLIGAAAADASGQALTKALRLEEDSEGQMPILQALAARSSFSGQRVRRRSDETALILNGKVVVGPGDSFAGFEGSIAPVEQLDRAVQADSERVFDELLGSPLRHIIESAERIAVRSDGPLRDEYAAYATDISAAARHLLSVVHSMGEETAAGRASVDLVELVYEAIGLVETAASEREIAVAVEPLRAFTAHGDSRSVIQILVNLISNAVRHSPVRATVTISFERAVGHSIVHVADDGPGIEPGDHERIFERFERGKAEEQGSGLGLAIARRLARSMDGEIQLQSSPGNGSRFSLVLPAA